LASAASLEEPHRDRVSTDENEDEATIELVELPSVASEDDPVYHRAEAEEGESQTEKFFEQTPAVKWISPIAPTDPPPVVFDPDAQPGPRGIGPYLSGSLA